MSARYLVNAGRLDASSWYLNEELEGSRFLGEGGHFIDTLSAWIGQPPVEVVAHQTPNALDLHATLRYADGSLGTITYAADGDSRFPKETLDVSGGGRNARLDNFTRATVWSRAGKDSQALVCRSGQGPARRGRGVPRGRAPRRPDADRPRLARRDDPRDDRRRREPGVRSAGGAMSRSVGWYVRRLRGMSPGEMASRVGDRARQARWARPPGRRRSRAPGRVPGLLAPPRLRGGPASGARDRVPAAARGGRRRGRRPAARRRLASCWASRATTSSTPTGSSTR